MSLFKKAVGFGLIAMIFSGCMGQQNPENVSMIGAINPEEVKEKISGSLFVTNISETRFEKAVSPSQVEIFYKKFNTFNKPSLIKNWESLYIIGEGSKPSCDYDIIAGISYYTESINDSFVISRFKEKASELGGTAVIGMFRKPLIKPGVGGYAVLRPALVSKSGVAIVGPESKPIEAFSYYGEIIRKK